VIAPATSTPASEPEGEASCEIESAQVGVQVVSSMSTSRICPASSRTDVARTAVRSSVVFGT
jgi:hypothetical protein